MVVWQQVDVDGGVVAEQRGDAFVGVASCWVAVEQEQDVGCLGQPTSLVRRQRGSEQCDGAGDVSLGETHDGPGALDDDDAGVARRLGAVRVVQDLGLWEGGREAPLALAADGVGIESRDPDIARRC